VSAFIHINFTDLIPDQYQPTEEVIDCGYATSTFCYQDVTVDNGDFHIPALLIFGIQSRTSVGISLTPYIYRDRMEIVFLSKVFSDLK